MNTADSSLISLPVYVFEVFQLAKQRLTVDDCILQTGKQGFVFQQLKTDNNAILLYHEVVTFRVELLSHLRKCIAEQFL